MKRTIAAVAVAMVVCLACTGAYAGWSICSGCHNGAMAINKDGLVAKYTSVEALVKGAQAVENPMMAKIKQDVEGLKAAAAELGLKPEKE